MHNFCFAVTSRFLFRLQLALFNTSFRHVICAHTPRRAMLQERSERCSHKEEEEEEVYGSGIMCGETLNRKEADVSDIYESITQAMSPQFL